MLRFVTDIFNPLGYAAFLKGSLPFTLVLAFCLDLALGDPKALPHPVVGIGRLIRFMEGRLRLRAARPERLRQAGFLLVFLLVPGLTLLMAAFLRALYLASPWALLLFRVFLCYQFLALKGLMKAGNEVALALRDEGLPAARYKLKSLVGRDTDELTAQEVIKGAVESLAENFSDGFVAPVFFFLLADLPGLVFYKTVNTLDSMVGYRNERYQDFGFASAKLDDLLNFIPARIGAFFLLLASFLLRYRGTYAFKIFIRDRNKHLSPNSGQLESVVAGALGLKLGGSYRYGGKLVVKPSLGDALEQPRIAHVDRARNLIFLAGVLTLLCSVGIEKLL